MTWTASRQQITDAITLTVPRGAASGSPLHQDTSGRAAPCGPADSTAHGPMNAGGASIIASRAARLRHSNGVQLARYLAIHQTLSRPCCEGVT